MPIKTKRVVEANVGEYFVVIYFSFLKSIFCAKVNPIVYQGYKSVTVFILCWLVLTTEVSDNKASDS